MVVAENVWYSLFVDKPRSAATNVNHSQPLLDNRSLCKMGAPWEAIIAACVPCVGGLASAAVTKTQITSWYREIKKPSWTPPESVFGPVWMFLYSSMGYASYLVWRDGGGFQGHAKVALTLYSSQLVLNWAWSPIFFYYHSFKWAAVEIVALTTTAVSTAISFYKINPFAGYTMLPYIAWLGYASALTLKILHLNSGDKEDKQKDK